MSRIFIAIDCQKDFIDGALPNREAQSNVVLANQAQNDARRKGFDINWTLDTHGADYPDTLEGAKLPIPHCIKNSPGWQFHDAVEPEADDPVFEKPTFGSVEMLNSMILDNDCEPIEAIIMCGYDTDICGISNALMLRAGLPNTPIYWLAFASAGSTSDNQIAALNVMLACQIEVIDTYAQYKALLENFK